MKNILIYAAIAAAAYFIYSKFFSEKKPNIKGIADAKTVTGQTASIQRKLKK